MMMALPLKAFVFYLAMLFLPQDVSQFTATIEGQTIQWTQTQKGWEAKNLTRKQEIGNFVKKGNTIISQKNGRSKKTEMSKLFEIKKKTVVKNVTQIPLNEKAGFGLPVMVTKKKNRIVLSQMKGVIFSSPVFIDWKTK